MLLPGIPGIGYPHPTRIERSRVPFGTYHCAMELKV